MKNEQLSLTELIEFFLGKLPEYTKEEADFIQDICTWTDEQRSAFVIAKRVFEDKE